MLKRMMMVWLAMMVMWHGPPANAGDFDGSKDLQCNTTDGVQYHQNGGHQPFHPESVGLPQIFIIDFKQNVIRPTRQSVIRKRSKIKRIERVEDKIMLQGAEDGMEGVQDGVGWTMALVQDSGRFVITASGGDLGYIVFGRCKVASP